MKKLTSMILLLVILKANAQDNTIYLPKDSTRNLYVGYTNVIHAGKMSSFEATGCTIKKNGNTFEVLAPSSLSGKKTTVNIKWNDGTKSTFHFNVTTLPKPTVFIGTFDPSEKNIIKKDAFIQEVKSGSRAGFSNAADLKFDFTVSSFHLEIISSGKSMLSMDIKGNEFPEDALNMFSKLKNYTVKLTEVYLQSANGKLKSLPLTFTVE